MADEPIDSARQLLDVGERATPKEHELPTRAERNSNHRSCDFTPIEYCARRNLERNRSELRENATQIKVISTGVHTETSRNTLPKQECAYQVGRDAMSIYPGSYGKCDVRVIHKDVPRGGLHGYSETDVYGFGNHIVSTTG